MAAAHRSDGVMRTRLSIAGCLSLALLISACTASSGPETTRTTGAIHTVSNPCLPSAKATPGGMITVGISQHPNFIFPIDPFGYDTPSNIGQFQQLMYRPLYWFGTPVGSQVEPTLNECLSLAEPPTFSPDDRTAVVKLKPYKWSDGEQVTAQDVVFFMNLLRAEKQNWGGYFTGELPDDVSDVVADSPTEVRFTFTRSLNPTWVLYNQLSAITPLPLAWDVTRTGAARGSGDCSSASYEAILVGKGPGYRPLSMAASACADVYDYLASAAGFDPSQPNSVNFKEGTYARNPLWQIVDGPWRLRAFSDDGETVFQPNLKYSGPVRPAVREFVEASFGNTKLEVSDVGSPGLQAALDVQLSEWTGQSAVRVPAGVQTVANRPWATSYLYYNFRSTGDDGEAGAIFSQLYIRQAMQLLVDQPALIAKIDFGYAVPVTGPVPLQPSSPFADTAEQQPPYPYNPGRAKQLLAEHGWRVVPGGTTVCVSAALCGAGIKAGTKLAFVLDALLDYPNWPVEVAETHSWALAGIQVSIQQFISGIQLPQWRCRCSWTLLDYGGGGGWFPGIEPTGEQTLSSGVPGNLGSYSDPVADADIAAVIDSSSNHALDTYEHYLAQQLPVIWQPNPDTLTLVGSAVGGVLPDGPNGNITPEYWYLKS